MYNQSYEDYLNMVLGVGNNNGYHNYNRNDYLGNMQMPYNSNNYLNNMQAGYNGNFYQNNMQSPVTNNTYGMSRQQLEALLPDIYGIINPLVVKTWNINTKVVTKELIEEITEQIYDTVSDHREIKLNINLVNFAQDKDNRSDGESKENMANTGAVDEKNESRANMSKENTKTEVRAENRHETEEVQTNYLLKDLIKIMVIKDLMERQTVAYVSMY